MARHSVTKFTIKSFILQSMPTSDEQFSRTLTANLNSETCENSKKVVALLKENLSEETDLKQIPALLGGFVGIMVRGKPVVLPTHSGEGWKSEIASFVLEIESNNAFMMSETTHYIAGYTDRPVLDSTGKLSEGIKFVINSIHDYRVNMGAADKNELKEKHHLSSLQLLSDQNYPGIYGKNIVYRLRPYEIATTMDLKTSFGESDQFIKGEYIDLRCTQTRQPVFFEYSDNDPTIWAQRLITQAVLIEHNASEGVAAQRQSVSGKLQDIAMQLSPRAVSFHPFMYQLSVFTENIHSHSFTIEALQKFDSNVMDKVIILPGVQSDSTKTYASFSGSSTVTLAASYIANSIPAIMAKYGIRDLDFCVQNYTGSPEFVFSKLTPIHHGEVDCITTYKFAEEIQQRVMNNISYQGNLQYSVEGCFDLFGMSTFALEYDMEGIFNYIFPTFANSCFSPQITTDKEHLNKLASAFSMVFDII